MKVSDLIVSVAVEDHHDDVRCLQRAVNARPHHVCFCQPNRLATTHAPWIQGLAALAHIVDSTNAPQTRILHLHIVTSSTKNSANQCQAACHYPRTYLCIDPPTLTTRTEAAGHSGRSSVVGFSSASAMALLSLNRIICRSTSIWLVRNACVMKPTSPA